MPDFFKDLTNVGLTEDEFEPLFHSAEVYIRMWERINGGPPSITPLIKGTLGKGDEPNDVRGFEVGSDSTNGELRAQRYGG